MIMIENKLMKFIIKGPLKENLSVLTRKIGYHFRGEDLETKEINLIRPIERSGYPRFHLFLQNKKEELVFNLHLDQKKPTYKGVIAHAGEYNGKVVETEAERIKQIISP